MFQKILIANRGEIACRIIHTAKRMGIRTAVIYSPLEQATLAMTQADEAICIEAATPRASYLDIDQIIAVAKNIGAEAIHPGYGFLSENADFARACEEAGIVFIGPSPHALELMGQKDKAKQLMQKIGVPIIPGFFEENQNNAALIKAAQSMGFPLLIKAVAGGGGKAMRIVNSVQELEEGLDGVRREAQQSFANPGVMLEKYLEHPRHIEVQIFGDHHQNYLHLFDRDCSVQRRYQKVMEEAPALNLSEKVRLGLWESALKAAQAIDYVGAGTVEFLVSGEHHYFLEMNTRLQVEHPVTEFITGVDLVEWQLNVANKQPLPIKQNDLHIRGHAFEVRICAEDPEHGFLPATGKVAAFAHPKQNLHLRLESGVETGDIVTPYFDSLLAKIIVWDKTREQALNQLQETLQQTCMVGITTNLGLLQRLAHIPEVLEGKIHTHLLNELPFLTKPSNDLKWVIYAVAHELQRAKHTYALSMPWSNDEGWRMNASSCHEVRVIFGEILYTIKIHHQDRNMFTMHIADASYQVKIDYVNPIEFFITINGQGEVVRCYHYQDSLQMIIEHDRAIVTFVNLSVENQTELAGISPSLQAPMPGTIVQVFVNENQEVAAGDRLLTLEAMKMEHTIRAPTAGTIQKLYYKTGDVVKTGATLVELNIPAE